MYRLLLRKSVERIFRKMAKRQPEQLRRIQSKLEEIVTDPHRFKNLRAPLQRLRRVHIDGSYVLFYSIDEANNAVIVEDYDHHDRVYRR